MEETTATDQQTPLRDVKKEPAVLMKAAEQEATAEAATAEKEQVNPAVEDHVLIAEQKDVLQEEKDSAATEEYQEAIEEQRPEENSDPEPIVSSGQEPLNDPQPVRQNGALKSAIESLLFVAGNPLSVERLQGLFEDTAREEIEAQLDALSRDYDTRGAGIMLAEVAGGYQLVTRPENAAWIRKFRAVKVSTRLSRPALETLAIIAYKQPITRTEIELVRGVNIGGIVRNLMERRLVKIVGKKDVPGKPMLYGTTPDFLQYFGLKDLTALPTLKEFQELEAGEEVMESTETNREPSEDGVETEAAEAMAADTTSEK